MAPAGNGCAQAAFRYTALARTRLVAALTHAGAEQVADLAGGLFRDELVDLLPGLLRGPAEVGVAHRDGRRGGQRRGEAGLQRQARLHPHRCSARGA